MKKYRILSVVLAASLAVHALPVCDVLAAPDSATTDTETVNKNKDDVVADAGAAEEVISIETIEINSVEDFLAFADNCHLDSWSANKIVTLQQDIDLSGIDFEMIPVFAGTFDGGGHTISGFHPSEQGYIVGLFRYIAEGGAIKNLTLNGNITAVNEKECVGSICGVNYGTIKNCSFHGIVSGKNTVGGIAGINEVSGCITNCQSNARITGYYSTGGIAGSNHGIITFCNNHSGINNDSDWVEEDDEMGTGLFFSFQTSGDEVELYSGVDTGGIAGYSDGLIERCNNYGIVGYEHTGYNIGGIVGRQAGVLLLCTNNSEVYGRKDVGGIVGQMEPDIEVDEAQSLRNAINKLHDLIEKTLDDMHDGKNTFKSDFDSLSLYGDAALTSGDALVGQMTDFVDDNVEQIQLFTDRIDHVMDMLPDIMDNVAASGEAFDRMNKVIDQLADDLNFMDSLDDSAYNGTDYNRITMLSTVGGYLFSNSLNPSAGDKVTITVTPDSGYVLDRPLSIVEANGTFVSYSDDDTESDGSGQYTFAMPSSNVQVTAYFRHQDDSGVSYSVDNTYQRYVTNDASMEDGPSDEVKATGSGDGDGDTSNAGEGDEGTSDNGEGDVGTSDDEMDDPQNDMTDDEFDAAPYSDSNSDTQIILHSNLSGSASYRINDDIVTLTVRPDTAYTLNSAPVVADSTGETLPVKRLQNGSYQYTFDISGASLPVRAEISFSKLNKSAAIDNSADNIQASIRDLQQSSEYVDSCLHHIDDIMSGRDWDGLEDYEKEEVIEEIVTLYGYMGQMSSSASSILSSFSTMYNVLTPYVQDAAKDAAEDIDQATDEIQSMINSLKEAGRGIRGIINYINAQPDIRFSTLGSTFDANREDLHTQLVGISDSLKNLSDNASAYSDIVNDDLKAVNDQLNVVFNLLADQFTNSSETSVEELYEEVDEDDIESIITGRTDSCINNGIVKGDINIGGIAGSMSIDEEDPEDNAAGSVNYQVGRRFITKCIINDSVNRGYVTAKKDGAGGIVGYMRHGIVIDCEGYGSVESIEGDYVGGIAGESLTVIRSCYALCSVSGGREIGGIAGYANTLEDCYAIVSTEASAGRAGAIAGQISINTDGHVSGNYYVGDDIYGIDNISYANMAEPITYAELLTVENLPTDFWHLKVTYRIEDTYLGTQEVKFGESLANLNYPEIPAKEGYYGIWPDLSDQVMTCNLLIDGSYINTVTVVESAEKSSERTGDWQKPYALVEQTFTEDTVLNATLSTQNPPQEADGKDYVIYDILLENGDIKDTETFAIRLLNPYGDNVSVWGYLNGSWSELDSKIRGQYLQVTMTGPKESFCIIDNRSNVLLIVVAVITGVTVLALIIFLLQKLKRRIAGHVTEKQLIHK